MSESEGGSGEFPTPPPAVPSPMPPPPPNMAPPPGYVSYSGPTGGAFTSMRSVGKIGKALFVLMAVYLPIGALNILTTVGAHDKAQDFLDGVIDEDTYKKDIGLNLLLGLLIGLLTIALFVLTIVWMFRMAKNLQILQRIGTWKPGWAIGGWFTPPFAIYVVPFLMLRDLWKGSDRNSTNDWRTNPVSPLVNIWWVLFGLVAPALQFAAGASSFKPNADTEDIAKNSVDHFGLTLAGIAAQLLAGIAFLLLVRQLTDRHKQAIDEP
jgi:hypothetical protein